MSKDYVKSYINSWHTKLGELRNGQANTVSGAIGSGASIPFADSSFDETRIIAVLHHLPDPLAVKTIREMARVTRNKGQLVGFEPVLPKNPLMRPLAYLTLKLDRGDHMRTEEELLNILTTVAVGEWDITRFTYSFTGLEAVIFKLEVQNEKGGSNESDPFQ